MSHSRVVGIIPNDRSTVETKTICNGITGLGVLKNLLHDPESQGAIESRGRAAPLTSTVMACFQPNRELDPSYIEGMECSFWSFTCAQGLRRLNNWNPRGTGAIFTELE